MKIARYDTGAGIRFGLLDGDVLRRLPGTPFDGLVPGPETDRLGEVRLLAPVDPPRVFAVGLNYVARVRETWGGAPDIPLTFMKPSTTVIGTGADVAWPREAIEVQFEGELAVVIGRTGRRIAAGDALAHVLGYTCANDLSERVIQKREMLQGAVLIGKGFDGFCPLGPVIATGLDPTRLSLEARVNGAVRQHSTTADLLFPVADLIAWISSAITLLPGDVILTGTPPGAGPVVPGDTVEIEIEGIGVLRNRIVAEA